VQFADYDFPGFKTIDHVCVLGSEKAAWFEDRKATSCACMKTLPDEPYHEGARHWQDRFDSRRLADRLAETLSRPRLVAEDRAFHRRQPLFFLATADAEGRPDVSYKGGAPGFVRIVDERTLAFPSYDGNGMFRSLGKRARETRALALLFIDFELPQRLRVLGRASAADDDAMRPAWPEAQLVVRVAVELVFPNCPRYHPPHGAARDIALRSVRRPADAEPAWKRFEIFRDVFAAPALERGPVCRRAAAISA